VYATGIHPSSRPLQAILELVAFILFYYVPMLGIGVRTLNGDARFVWAGIVWTCIGLAFPMGLMLGLEPITRLAIFAEAKSDAYTRVQLASLLCVIAAAGMALYALAAVRVLARRELR
jgi:hypothetical protein